MDGLDATVEGNVAFEDLPTRPPAPAAFSGPETLDLSETSKAAQERQAASLMTLEIDKRARSIFVPADIEEQKNFLRSMNEPVTLFGERPEDRRTRLQRFLAAKELAGDGGAIPAAFSSSAYGARAEKQTEMFYSPASEHLLAARQFMGKYSFERAAKRLRAQASVATSEEACAAEDRYATKAYKSLKRMRPVLSQVADERPLSTCALSSDGSLLATGSWGSVVKVWDAHSCEPIALMRGHTDRVVSVAWHPAAGKGRGTSAAVHGTHTGQSDAHLGAARGMLVSGSIDGTAMLWKVPEELLGHHESSMPGLDSSTGHRQNESALDIGLREVATFKGHTQRLANVAFHPSGRYVGTSSYDRTWRLWDVERHHELLLQEGHAREVYALAFHPDGSLVASGDLGGVGRIWDLRSGRSVFVLSGHSKQLLTLDFSPDGFHIASGSDDNTSIIWDLRQKKSVYTLPAHTSLVSKVKFAPVSGEFLVTSSFDGTIKTWNTRDWAPIGSYSGHEGKVTCVDVFHNEQQLVSVSFDRTVKIWEHEESSLLV